MIFLVITLVLSLTLNVAFFFGIRNLLSKQEDFEDFFMGLQTRVMEVLGQMHRIDASGAFEHDDEVGATFKGLREVTDSLQQFLVQDDGSEKTNEEE